MWTVKMIHNQKFNLSFLLLIAVTLSTRVAADDCCKPGETMPDRYDCAKYFVCCTGEFKPMSCCKGEYFNTELGKCVKDNGECNCNGTTCVDGDKKADTSNCANFLLCTNGEYQTVSCGSGNYWNVKNKECQKDNGICVTTPAPNTPIPTLPTPTLTTPCTSTPTPATPTPTTPSPTTPKPTTPKPTTPTATTPIPTTPKPTTPKLTTPCPSTPTTPAPTTPIPTTPKPTTPIPITSKPTTPKPTTPTPTTPCPSTPTTPAPTTPIPTTPKPTTPIPTTPKPTTPKPTTPKLTTPCPSTPTTPAPIPTTPKPTTPIPTTPKPTTPKPTTPTPTTPCPSTPTTPAPTTPIPTTPKPTTPIPTTPKPTTPKPTTPKLTTPCPSTPTTPKPTTPKPTTPTPTTPCPSTPTTPAPTTPIPTTPKPTTPIPTTPKPTTPKPTTPCPSTPTTPIPTTPKPTTPKLTTPTPIPTTPKPTTPKPTTPKPTTPCPSIPTTQKPTTQKPTTPTPTTPCSTACVEGDVKNDFSSCDGFYKCISGKYVAQVCASGDYWNPYAKECQKNNGNCPPTPPNPTPATCVEGAVKENPSNCAGFYKCINGQYVAQVCSSGNYWNVIDKQCQKNDGNCVTTPIAPNTPTPPTPTPATCEEGAVKENPSNCAGFYKCINGQYVAQVCSSGNYWNVIDKQCQKNDGNCVTTPIAPNTPTPPTPTPATCEEGAVKENPFNCAGFYKCINGQYVAQVCSSGNYWNVIDKQCQKNDGNCVTTPIAPNTPTPPTPTPATCEEGAVKENPFNCAGFYKCINGQYVAQVCSSGNYWNVIDKQCQKNDGNCVTTPIAPNTPTPPTPTPATCEEGAVKENPSNCAGFYKCINGQYVAQVCSSGNYWNVIDKQCQKDDGNCVTTPSTPTPSTPTPPTPTPSTCVEGDKEVNPANCAGYLECINNVMVKRQCPADSYFDEPFSMCIIDVNGTCIPKVCDPECCDKPNDWLGPVDQNCSAFIQCLYGNKFQQRCPNNLQFNNVTKECDFPENVQCDDGTAPPSGPTAGPSGTYCESKGRCVGKSDGAMMADAKDVCSGSYVVCQCECEVNFKCSAGLVFNTKVRSCDWPANADC